MNNDELIPNEGRVWKTTSVAIQSRWWTRESSAWDRGGSFNMALYLRFCEAQISKDYEEQVEKTNRK